MKHPIHLTFLAGLLLSACGSDPAETLTKAAEASQCLSSPQVLTSTIASNQGTLCAQCVTDAAEAAIDTDPESYATLSMNLASGTGYETRQSLMGGAGQTLPPGTIAGVRLGFNEEFSLDYHVYLVTSLGDEIQERLLWDAQTVSPTDPTQPEVLTLVTRKPYDRVGVLILSGGLTNVDAFGEQYRPSLTHAQVRVYELCGNVAAQ